MGNANAFVCCASDTSVTEAENNEQPSLANFSAHNDWINHVDCDLSDLLYLFDRDEALQELFAGNKNLKAWQLPITALIICLTASDSQLTFHSHSSTMTTWFVILSHPWQAKNS